MTDRIVATSIEKAFVESWMGWDQIEPMILQFSNCVLTEAVKQVTNLWGDADYTVVVDCEFGKVDIYVGEEYHPSYTIEWVPSITRVINNKQENK